MSRRQDEPGVGPSLGQIGPGQRFEMPPVVGYQSLLLSRGEGQLLRVGITELTGVAGGGHGKPAGAYELGDEDVDVLIQVELDESSGHDPLTRGSTRSSGMWLLSM